jgi:hypothetical protein
MASLPPVDEDVDFADVVSKARQLCEPGVEVPGHEPGERVLAVITPGRMVLPQSACPPGTVPPAEAVAAVRKIVPEDPSLRITVIGATSQAARAGTKGVTPLNQLVPFMGYLLGMAWLGHNVILFEGHPSAFRAGCQDADLLMVDEAVADLLLPDWVQTAARVMRRPRILLALRSGEVGLLNPDSDRWSKPRAAPPAKRPWWWPF